MSVSQLNKCRMTLENIFVTLDSTNIFDCISRITLEIANHMINPLNSITELKNPQQSVIIHHIFAGHAHTRHQFGIILFTLWWMAPGLKPTTPQTRAHCTRCNSTSARALDEVSAVCCLCDTTARPIVWNSSTVFCMRCDCEFAIHVSVKHTSCLVDS